MFLGSWFNVSSGRLEIRYKIGVKVVIQGPAVFAVDAADGGFLRLGNLLVCVEPGEGAARAGAGRGASRRCGRARTPAPRSICLPNWRITRSFASGSRRTRRAARTLMSDRGAEFALSIGPDGVLVGYVFKSPVWLPVGDGEYSTPAFLQTGFRSWPTPTGSTAPAWPLGTTSRRLHCCAGCSEIIRLTRV